jgi:hypothetical protein
MREDSQRVGLLAVPANGERRCLVPAESNQRGTLRLVGKQVSAMPVLWPMRRAESLPVRLLLLQRAMPIDALPASAAADLLRLL